MAKLKDLAISKTTLSPLMVGQKLTTGEISDRVIHLSAVDCVSYEQSDRDGNTNTISYCVFTVQGAKGEKGVRTTIGFYCGGTALSDLGRAIIADDEAYAEFLQNGLDVKLHETKTSSGRNIVRVEIVEDDI